MEMKPHPILKNMRISCDPIKTTDTPKIGERLELLYDEGIVLVISPNRQQLSILDELGDRGLIHLTPWLSAIAGYGRMTNKDRTKIYYVELDKDFRLKAHTMEHLSHGTNIWKPVQINPGSSWAKVKVMSAA